MADVGHLSDLGRRHLTERPVRSGLVGLAIALGVAVLLGVTAGSTTIRTGLDDLVTTVGGNADVVASAAGPIGSSLPAGATDRLDRTDGVDRAVPVRATVGYSRAADRPAIAWTTVVVTVDPSEADLLGATTAKGRLPRSLGEIAMDERQAEGLGLQVGSAFTLAPTREGDARVDLEVVGLLARGALTEASIGEVVFGLPSLADSLGAPAEPVQALVVLDRGTDVAAWTEAHRADDEQVRLEDVASLRSPLDDLFDGVLSALNTLSMLALVLAGYLIHLAMTSSVAQRTRTYGTLLALGASRRQIASTVRSEVLWLAVVATSAGVVLGLGLAWFLADALSDLFDTGGQGLVVRPGEVVICAVAGMAIALLSSLVPARNAVRSAPIAAINGQPAPLRTSTRNTVLGLITLGVASVILVAAPPKVSIAGTPITLLGVGLVLPALLPRVAAAITPLIRRVSPGVGEVAVAHVVKERSRSALTAGLLVAVFSVTLLAASGYATFKPAFREYMTRQWGADVQLTTGYGLGESPIPPDITERARALEGVAAVTGMWHTRVDVTGLGGDRVLTVIDPATYFGAAGYLFVEGDEQRARAELGHGGVLVSSVLAAEQGWELGDDVEVFVGGRRSTFRIAATYSSLGDAYARAFVIGTGDADRAFGAPLGGPNTLWVELDPGVAPSSMIEPVRALAGPDALVRMRTGRDQLDSGMTQFNGVFGLFTMIEALAAVVGLLGIATTMAISVVERTREIGVLRAIGTRVREIRRMVFVEGMVLVTVALVLGVAVSWVLAHDIADSAPLLGFEGTTHYPWRFVPVVAAFAGIATMVASAIPARRAAQVDPCEALRLD